MSHREMPRVPYLRVPDDVGAHPHGGMIRPPRDGFFNPPELGTPIHVTTPAMAAETRHVEDPELTEACGALVEEEGGREFFRVAGWPLAA